MDNNYLWEIFTNNKQNISEDCVDHHHHLLQIPNFQLNGFSQDLIVDHGGSSVITTQFQTNCDQVYNSSKVSTSTSIIAPRYQTNCEWQCTSSTNNTSTSIIASQFQTNSDCLYKSSVGTRSTSTIVPGQSQRSCDRLYKSLVRTRSTILDNTKEGLRNDESNKLKKAVHRNIERNRRQEMKNLVTSLRSLISIEFIKVSIIKLSRFVHFYLSTLDFIYFFKNND